MPTRTIVSPDSSCTRMRRLHRHQHGEAGREASTTSAARASSGSKRARARPVDAAFLSLIRRQRGPASASRARLQSWQFPAHAGDARADQGLVQPEGKADQDRRESRQPRPVCRLPDGGSRDPKKPLRRRPAAHRRTATAASHVNSMRRSVSRVRQNPQEKCVLIAKSSALSTFDLASACLGAVRRRAGGNQADGSGLPGARNGRRLGLNRQQSGGCRLPTAWAAEAQFVPSPKPTSATGRYIPTVSTIARAL